MGTFFRPDVYERVGILPVEVYKKEGKSVISVGKKAQKGWKMPFMAVKKSRKRSAFVIYSLKTMHLQEKERTLSWRKLKGMQSSKQGTWKGYHWLVNKRYMKGLR